MAKKILAPYQRESAIDLHEKKRIIIADEMGMGKCAQALYARKAIESLDNSNYKTLIVSPSSVMPHWKREVGEWYDKDAMENTTLVRTKTFDRDVERAKDSDFVVMSYSTLSYFGKHQERMHRLRDMGFGYGILDEAQNAKNPCSTRSKKVRDLFGEVPYLSILSGTPVPNTIVDIYVLFNLLQPDVFKIDTENPSASIRQFYKMFAAKPEFVRDVFRKFVAGGSPRTRADFPHKDLPALKTNLLEILLEGEHRDVYLNLYENDTLPPGIKLWQLRKAALDPNLVDPRYLNSKLASRVGNMESSVYTQLDELAERVVDENGKLLVFSDLKTGVTDYLRGRWARFKPLVIDGDTPTRNLENYDEEQEDEKREFIRKQFQQNPDHKMLIATTTMNEGVDLTAATDIVHLRMPYTPHSYSQRTARSRRIGEIKKDNVNAHIVRATLEDIATIDEGIERLVEDKTRIINFMMESPTRLTRSDLEELKKNGHIEKSKHISPFLKSPKQAVLEHLSKNIRNKGFARISRLYQEHPEEAERFAKLYAKCWEGSYGGNTANLYAKVIHTLEETQDLERKLDIASGPFSLSRRIKQPVTNIDINPFMLEAGRLLEQKGKIVPGNIALQGCFHDLPVGDSSFDLALCSLAYHASKLKVKKDGKEVREREQAFRELHRVLRPDGFGMFALPSGAIIESDFESFYDGLGRLGLKVLPFSGFYSGPKGNSFKVYLGAVKRNGVPQEEELDDNQLELHVDRESARVRSGKEKKGGLPKPKKEIKTEFVGEFFNTRTRQSLEDSIRGCVA